MYFIDQVHLAIQITELVFGIDQDKSLLSGHFGTARKEGQCILFELHIVILRHDAPAQNFLAANVFIMPF